LREHLARAVKKATGASGAEVVVPNHGPVFPPTPPEGRPARLDAHGEVVFRRARPVAGMAPTSPSPRAATPSAMARGGEVAEMPVKLIPNQLTDRHTAQNAVQSAVAAVIRAIEAPPRHADSPQASPEVAKAAVPASEARDVRKEEIAFTETASRQVISHETEPQETIHSAPPPISADKGTRSATEETTVQVHIGRVEVRVAASAPAPAPPATKTRGPRGFAEYEAVRRYVTRNRT